MASSEAGSSEHELEELDRGFYHPHPPSPRHSSLHQRRTQNGKRADPYKPESSYVRSNSKVDQESVYSVTFKDHDQEDRARCRGTPIKPHECIDNLGSGATKIESTSVMRNDFRQHEKPQRATLHRPQPETQIEGGAFETDTSYTKDYSKKQIKVVHAKRPKEYHAPTAPFDGSTTVKSDYTAHPGYRRDPPFRPVGNQQLDKSEFSSSTTTGDSYGERPARRMDKPTWAKQRAHEPTPNENAYSSSYQSDFVRPAGLQRAHLIKPVPQDKDLLQGPRTSGMPKGTTYREQFVTFSGKGPAKSCKQNRVYEPPIERFQAESVYHSNYTGESAPHAKQSPRQRRNSDEAPHSVDFHTTYKDTFKSERPLSCPAKELLTASDEFGHIGFRNGRQIYVQKSPRRCKTPKDLDPLFAATPESQKTDRERSSSRPSSAGKTPRSPSKADRPASSRTSRPTTPRASSRPSSGHKDIKTPAQTSPRKAPLSNRNNSNSNAAHKTPAPKASSPRKTDTKSANRNSSTSNAHTTPKTSPRPASASTDKKAEPKADKSGDKAASSAPPPIRRPPKKTTQSPGEVPTKPVTTAPATASTRTSTAAKTPAVAPAAATTAPAVAKVPVSSPMPAAAAVPAAVPASSPMPTAAKVAAPPVQPVKPLPTEVPAPKPVEKPAVPSMVSTSPMSTSAPAAPVTNSAPVMSDQAMKASIVEPMPIKPITAATAAAAPIMAPQAPPTLVAAPPAPVMPPVPPQQQQQAVVPPMDLSMFDTPSSPAPVPQPLLDHNDLSPKMPVIAPPPAPAQPVVRMGNGPREANLLD